MTAKFCVYNCLQLNTQNYFIQKPTQGIEFDN